MSVSVAGMEKEADDEGEGEEEGDLFTKLR